MEKPWSEACERNWRPILEVLRQRLPAECRVLEIGSGTGQHALRFARALPGVRWQASEVEAAMPGLQSWLDEVELPNLPSPVVLDVCCRPWPVADFEVLFTANTLHIVSMAHVECLFTEAGRRLPAGGLLLAYGPFRLGGRHTAESNERFDTWLKARDPESGVRDLDELNRLAGTHGLVHVESCPMPANNFIQIWRREPVGEA